MVCKIKFKKKDKHLNKQRIYLKTGLLILIIPELSQLIVPLP